MSDSNWHLRKDVTVGNLLTSVMAVIALVGSYYTLDKRIALNTQAIDNQIKTENEHYEDVKKSLDRIEDHLIGTHTK